MKWLEKSVLGLMTGVMPVFIAACYGTGDDLSGPNSANGTVVNKSTGMPIANIAVQCLADGKVVDETYTLSGDGSYSLTYLDEPCTTLSFEDVDGVANGGAFKNKLVGFVEGDTPVIELEPAE